VIVRKTDIGPILAGELDEVVLHVQQPPAIGSFQAVQSAVGKKAKCTVLILDTWPCVHGGHVIRFQLAARPEAVQYLQPKGGYTEDPSRALRDHNGAEWTVPKKWTDPGVAAREAYRRQLELERMERMSPGGLLDELLAIARGAHMDVRDRARKIEREIELLQRDLDERAA
jgi:hypothetical protein